MKQLDPLIKIKKHWLDKLKGNYQTSISYFIITASNERNYKIDYL